MGTLFFIRTNLRWLAAGFLLTFASCFGQTFFISIFAGEIMAAFSLSHGEWGGIYMVGTLASAAVMVWAGVLTDVFRVRALGAVVLIFLAAACLAMAANNFLWALPVIIFALRLFGQGMASHAASVAMARWYVAERGRALAVASFGFLVGEAFLPLIFVALLGVIGWRVSWVLSAGLALALIPVLLVLLSQERTPQSAAHENQSLGMGQRHWTRPEMLRHPLFWLLMPFLLGQPAFGTAFFFHQVHLAEVKGWSHLELVALFPVYTGVSLLATIVSGFAIDRVGAGRLLPVAQLPMALGFAIFSLSPGLAGAALGVALFGISSGINATLPAAFWAEYYGTRHLGAIKALATAVMVLGSAVGPGLTGVIIDAGMSFADQMIWVSGFFVLAAGMAFAGVARAELSLQRA